MLLLQLLELALGLLLPLLGLLQLILLGLHLLLLPCHLQQGLHLHTRQQMSLALTAQGRCKLCYSLRSAVLNQGRFMPSRTPEGTLGDFWGQFGPDATNTEWERAGDAVAFSRTHRAAPATRDYPSQNTNSAKVEKSYTRATGKVHGVKEEVSPPPI